MKNMVNAILALIIALSSSAFAQNYRIDRHVIGSGGGHSQSANYQVDGTIGQPIVGNSSSANYRIESGFWVSVPAGSPGCVYLSGDANGNGVSNLSDIIWLVNFIKGVGGAPIPDCNAGNPPPCNVPGDPFGHYFASYDVNGNCVANLSDITYYVRKIKGEVQFLICPDCPPAIRELPAIEPIFAPIPKTSEKLNAGNLD